MALNTVICKIEIKQSVETKYKVNFPMMSKVYYNLIIFRNVIGAEISPVYSYLSNKKKGILGLSSVKWNFEVIHEFILEISY